MGFDLEASYTLLLLFCLFCACAFEFVNGFHDTANAVATVIYTNSLPPLVAVVYSGILNFLGLMLSVGIWGIGVAMGIINMLPVETLVDQNLNHSLAMVFALLLTAIFWNLGTWYYGLPSSSSHTLIGSILGVGLAFSLLPESTGTAVNWSKAGDIGLSLLISPLFGFSVTIILMFLLKRLTNSEQLFREPKKRQAPPWWVRGVLILTCGGVSFAHGANDGQKGVGLIMLILIGIVPARYALDHHQTPEHLCNQAVIAQGVYARLDTLPLSVPERVTYRTVVSNLAHLNTVYSPEQGRKEFSDKASFKVRKDILLISRETDNLLKSPSVSLSDADREQLTTAVKAMRTHTDYAPDWVVVLISLSLGLGTMVGWKRIVETIGEKIGKQHLTYAQGMSSELVAAGTIALSTSFGLPVSTTHVLSSGIAGSMVASKGLKNLQPGTVRNIALAWLLTLPVTLTMSGTLYLLFRTLF